MKNNIYIKILFVISSLVLSIYGIYFLNWNIGSLYFWFLVGYIFEFFFTCLRLRLFWKNFNYPGKNSDKQGFFIIGIVGFVLIFIFTVAAFRSQQISRTQFFEIFLNQKYLILLLFSTYAGIYYINFTNKFFLNPDFNFHTKIFSGKLIILGIIYVLSIFQFHVFSNNQIEISRTYLLFLGIALAVGEAAAETILDLLGKKKTI